MKKSKMFYSIFIALVLLLVIPTVSNAATEYTYSDEEQGIQWSYQLDESNNVIELKCKTQGKIGAVTIPSTIEDKTVITLGNNAFKDFSGITSVTMPNTITRIGTSAFKNCTGLTALTLPDSVTIINDYAFGGCSGIKSLTLSNNLSSIGCYAFSNCTGLQSLAIPNSVTAIEKGGFDGCSGLKEITLSENLTKIAEETFMECSGLTSVILPDSVTTIEGGISFGAFAKCTKLAKILIPDSVSTIGPNAFRDCKKLTIYGNDEMESKVYAQEHEIPFDYIENWDKEDSGADVTPPTVGSIQVTFASIMDYNKDINTNMYMIPAGAKLAINVNFNEAIEGTTVPTLTIKFGDGENIELTEGIVGGTTITYEYTVKNTDKGVMTTKDLSGGNIKDAAGNVATLTCPEVSIQHGFNELVYANGTAIDVEDGGNPPADNSNKPDGGNPPADNSNKPDGGNPPADNSNKPNGGSTPEDPTTSKGKMPYMGLSTGIVLAIVVLLAVCVFTYFKSNKFKNI